MPESVAIHRSSSGPSASAKIVRSALLAPSEVVPPSGPTYCRSDGAPPTNTPPCGGNTKLRTVRPSVPARHSQRPAWARARHWPVPAHSVPCASRRKDQASPPMSPLELSWCSTRPRPRSCASPEPPTHRVPSRSTNSERIAAHGRPRV